MTCFAVKFGLSLSGCPYPNDTNKKYIPLEITDSRGMYSCLGLFPVVQFW